MKTTKLKNPIWFNVISIIYNNNLDDLMYIRQIEKVCTCSHHTCSNIIYNLEDNNLLERKLKHGKKFIELTAEGKKLAQIIEQIKMMEIK